MHSHTARFAAALALGIGVAVAAGPRPAALPFIENDFTSALARAKTSGRPLFVEVWAPW